MKRKSCGVDAVGDGMGQGRLFAPPIVPRHRRAGAARCVPTTTHHQPAALPDCSSCSQSHLCDSAPPSFEVSKHGRAGYCSKLWSRAEGTPPSCAYQSAVGLTGRAGWLQASQRMGTCSSLTPLPSPRNVVAAHTRASWTCLIRLSPGREWHCMAG